jgi:hypothetical protein
MYKIEKQNCAPDNFHAGEFPVENAVQPIKAGKTITKYMPVKLVDGKLEPVVKIVASAVDAVNAVPAKTLEENTTENLYGIAAEDGTTAGAVVYLTGDFFANELVLNSDITVEMLKPAFRKLGIYLK